MLPPLSAIAETCNSHQFDQTAKVKRIFDGDTIQLSSGKKIRLIGINTPEMNYDRGHPDPYAKKAKQFLNEKILNKSIKLRFGQDKKDKYKRYLAHVFLNDGTNIQAEMLRAGLAFNIAIPPNLSLQNCYQTLEKKAKQQKLGIWNHHRYKPINANKVNKQTLGFYRVQGTIKQVKRSKKFVWLNLTDKMALRISKKDKHHFKSTSKDFWVGKKVIAKGWITQRKKRFSMRIKHQAAIAFD